jgi:hypothetical protein
MITTNKETVTDGAIVGWLAAIPIAELIGILNGLLTTVGLVIGIILAIYRLKLGRAEWRQNRREREKDKRL